MRDSVDVDYTMNKLSQFESLNWPNRNLQEVETPAITPGHLSGAHTAKGEGYNPVDGIQYGIHWHANSFPSWIGKQPPKDAYQGDGPAGYGKSFGASSESNGTCIPPFNIFHIAHIADQIMDAFGFQQDVSICVFELLMSQLDSRSSRSNPTSALRSLHREYISGTQANYRKWYFAAEMDVIDQVHRLQQEASKESTYTNSGDLSFDFTDEGEITPKASDKVTFKDQILSEEAQHYERTLEGAEAIWDYHYSICSDNELLVDILIYLFCWTEANQIRFMPECLAFIVKCAFNYYHARFPSFQLHSKPVDNLPKHFFLDGVITPIYSAYCSYNFILAANEKLIRKEGDHKDFIGYDDMNQLFWYKRGLGRIKVKSPLYDQNHPDVDEHCDTVEVISLLPQDWLLALQEVDWKPVFSKTYRESRSWLHSVTNFSRIWILHASMFWFYTAYHTPSLYSPNSSYSNPIPPKEFVKWTIMSFGGAFAPLITLLGLMGELRFIPRGFPGAKPLFARCILIITMLLVLLIPGVCNLTLNTWTSDDTDLMPATVTSGVLFTLAVSYSLYLSFQPLDSVHGYNTRGTVTQETTHKQRKYLANHVFTGSFPRRRSEDAVLSWLMCILVFTAKFIESYFFLTLSVRDPLYELGIMSLNENCVGDRALFGRLLCDVYPRILLGAVVVTDMILFFLDTYLWYVILNTIVSVSISFKSGTSIWTPWRNIYGRLAARISTKLLTSGVRGGRQGNASHSAFALRVVWNTIVDSMYHNHVLNREQAMRITQVNESTHEPAFFTTEEDGSGFESTPSTSNAHRRISFFAQSLSTPMKAATPVGAMPAFTVMIPHYKETMIQGLRESITATMGAKITALEYLQRLYKCEWDNFVQESHEQATALSLPSKTVPRSTSSSPSSSCASTSTVKTLCASEKSRKLAVQKLGFSTLDPNDTVRTRLWCSERTQTLFRTLKGFSNYTTALRVFFYAEEYNNESEQVDISEIEQEISDLCSRKFRLLVAMQLYDQFTVEQLQEVEIILNVVPELTVSYVEFDSKTGEYYTCMFDNSCPILDTGRRSPRLKIKLSGNPILGDGKADNQNASLPFYRGEYIQLIDANQDNYIEECLKIRNILMEFESYSPLTPPIATAHSKGLEDGIELYTPTTILYPDPAPVAIVGAREYIFSENIGILGDVAAGKEQTFGTLFSRSLAKIGAKLHYGHPDFLNAIFMTTRGGVSKAQRGLHLNEDIYAGMTAMLRGGRIKHTEYFQCGKGRDLGFVSILNFTAKIGAGMGEQILSREYFYMGTKLPFDQFISFYYAHPGFHLNNAFIMLSLDMLLVVILWISSIAAVNVACYTNSNQLEGEPRHPDGCTNITPLLDWIKRCVISIFLVFFVSLCPLFFQEFTEKGIIKSVNRIFRHFCSLSMLFEVFVCRIYARSFWEDMSLGGAKYLATGRGFAISRIQFYKLYENYNPEILSGLKSGLILLFSSIVVWNPGYLWFWATTVSLCFCPFLYNPHQFAFNEFFIDYYRLLQWFWNARISTKAATTEGHSWSNFTREAREKVTGVKKRSEVSESIKPAFKNAVLAKLSSAILCTLTIGVPYVYLGSQKKSRHQQDPNDCSIFLLSLCVAALPSVFSMTCTIAIFAISVVANLCGSTHHSNILAMITHTVTLLGLIASWWIMYIVSAYDFCRWILGIGFMCCLHHLWHTLLTNLVVRRQRDHLKTNDPWWKGNWRSAKVGVKLPLVVAEEFVVKQMENIQYSYDFLVCHLVLGLQSPLILIPFIDRVHSLFLMWLKPSVTTVASRTSNMTRKNDITSRYFCAIFVLNVGLLTALITFPLYAPFNWFEQAEELIVSFLITETNKPNQSQPNHSRTRVRR